MVQSKQPAWHDGWYRFAARVDSPNFDARSGAQSVSLLVIHSISLPPGEYLGQQVEEFFTNKLDSTKHPYFAKLKDVQVSAHFFIRRDGKLIQFVSADSRAWHAGVSCFKGIERCNDFSIGIELEGVEGDVFEPAQYDTLASLAQALVEHYPLTAVASHQHIAPDRKADPGQGFEWRLLAKAVPQLETHP